nr:uncharacterized protein LOC109162939 [Ipomoea trifida]
MGHRRFLGPSHRYRNHSSKFDGTKDLRSPPKMLSGSDVLNQLADINITFGKNIEMTEKGKRSRVRRVEDGDTQQWKKKSIFFQLPYWEFNLLRHNLDVMHIEKNVFDNVLFTLLNYPARSKDNLNARKDLVSMGIRDDLWPNENGKYSPSCFTMTNTEKDVFFATLKSVLLPDGYSSNISRCVDLKNRKIHGLKSHDCHILMEHLLPIAIHNLLPDQVCMALVELGSFFRQICSRVLNVKELDNLQSRLVLTLCHMEMIFPPSFFTVMVHLVVHLVDEVKLGGPVPYRWMYSIERYLGHLKSFVRNRANPEGSIAEGYIAEECLTFCSRYLEGVETRFNRSRRVDDVPLYAENIQSNIFKQIGRPGGSASTFQLTEIEKQQAHRYVLMNCKHVDKYVERFSSYNINGLRFRTVNREEGLKSQNSGVFVIAGTPSVASSRDTHGVFGDVAYYGKLVDIIELNYYSKFVVTLFKCIWADTTTPRGIRRDNYGFTEVNFSRTIHVGDSIDDEPYVLAEQAQMEQTQDNDALLEDIFPNQEQVQDNDTPQEQTQDSETPQEQNEDLQSSFKKKTRTTWEVDVINGEGFVKKKKLKVKEVWTLPLGEKIIVPFDNFGTPFTEAAGLFTGTLAGLAQESSSFPINFTDWRLMPKQYKEDIFTKAIKEKIRNEMDQDSSSQSQSISQDDPLGKAFGKEHPGRVRGLGFGPCPSKVFNNTSSSSNDNQMKEYVANLEKELAATKAQLQVQNDMQKAMGGALVAILEKTFGKVPEQFATLLNQTSQPVPDEGSKHQSSQGSGKQYSSSSHHGTIQGFFAAQARCCCRGVLSVTIQRLFAAAMPETGNAKLPSGLA